MKSFYRVSTLLLLSLSVSAFAQFKVEPFIPPPSLPEATPPAPSTHFLSLLQLKGPQPCKPDGLVTRTGNIVTVELNVERQTFGINNPTYPDNHDDTVDLRSYGGCKSGPIIEVAPGNTLRVNLNNHLSVNDPSCKDPTAAVGCFNTVNLHTHGLHVSPAGNSDNVLLNISPGTSFPYEINVPEDHPAGTFWYHAHRHGSTSLQVASGASGVLIIRGNRPYLPPTGKTPAVPGDIDTILHDAQGKALTERIFLLQQIAYGCFKKDPANPYQQIYTTTGLYDANSPNDPNSPATSPWICPAGSTDGVVESFGLQLGGASIWDWNGRFTSVNGEVEPTMPTIAAGEIQRWRFIHAGIHDTVNLQVMEAAKSPANAPNLIATSSVTGDRNQQAKIVAALCQETAKTLVPQFEIAVDGLTRDHIHAIDGDNEPGSFGSNFLQPGYRSDILIAFPHDGDYCVFNQAVPESERPTTGPNGSGGGQGPNEPQLLAYVHVRGGTPVTGNMQAYIEKALYAGNPQLPADARKGLLKGDLTPWSPHTDLSRLPNTKAPLKVNFFIGNIIKDKKKVFGFWINDEEYSPDRIDFTRQVNTIDDWDLTSEGEPHIFHIHVNPFEVLDVTTGPDKDHQTSIYDKDGKCIVPPDSTGLVNQYCGMYHTFRDTVFVQNNYHVKVRTFYDRYIGEFVIHCHILDHEDSGMMTNIEIVPDPSAPGGGLGMPGMKGMKHDQ